MEETFLVFRKLIQEHCKQMITLTSEIMPNNNGVLHGLVNINQHALHIVEGVIEFSTYLVKVDKQLLKKYVEGYHANRKRSG